MSQIGTIRWVNVGEAALALSAGALVVGTPRLSQVLNLPSTVILVVILTAAALPFLMARWRVTLAWFLLWLFVEDMVRKFAGNDLRIYFVKDLLYVILILAVVQDPAVRGAWKAATHTTRVALLALLAWVLVMAVPTAFQDPRLPLLGIRLDFLYVPLTIVGYLVATKSPVPQRWLLGVAVLGAAACSVGILQAIFGPGFLSPGGPTPGLGALELVRGTASSGPVYRPSGTFADPGRFSAMAVLMFAVSLSAFLSARGRAKKIAIVCVVTTAVAVWISGSRGPLLAASVLLLIATLVELRRRHVFAVGRAGVVVGVGMAAVIILAVAAPVLYASRLTFYSETLDPRSRDSEWSYRWRVYSGDTLRGIQLGGLFGQGTGRESIGQQYLYGGPERSTLGLYQVEAGYGSVAIEWGAIGLALWLVWSVSWLRRQWRSVRATSESALRAGSIVLVGWMVLFLFVGFSVGFQTFQNYISNSFFWFFSGYLFGLPARSPAMVA